MVEIKKIEDNKTESDSSSSSSASPKTDDVHIEHDDGKEKDSVETQVAVRKPKDDPLEAMRRQMEDAERKVAQEREARISAERERDAARTQINSTKETLAKSENEKISAQEAAIQSRVDSAKAELVNAKNAWIEAMDTGKPASVQADLQEKIAEATYKLKGAESAKTHFDNWKEQQKNKAVEKPKNDNQVSSEAQKWIDAHPRYNTDKKYRRAAIAAHEDAIDDGVAADSPEYFRRINAALAEAGLEGGDGATNVTTRLNSSATSTAAPASNNATEAGASGGRAAEEQRTGRRVFRLDGAMKDMAIKTYGKGTSFNLSDDEAYKRYAARQLEIQEKRKKGERI